MNEKVEFVINKLEQLKEKIKKDFKTEVIGIFGSFARGEENEKSDIDILVKFEKGATFLNLVSLANFLEETFSIKIDIVPIDVVREELRDKILQEAIYLWETQSFIF